MTRTRSAILTVLLGAALACGGGQEPVPPPGPVVAEPEPPPPPREADHVYYQVFWRDIHVMTVYATGGPLRSEEPDNPDEVFSGRSGFMSVVSHYFEQEPVMVRLVARAESLDDFLRILDEEGYTIREEILEEGY